MDTQKILSNSVTITNLVEIWVGAIESATHTAHTIRREWFYCGVTLRMFRLLNPEAALRITYGSADDIVSFELFQEEISRYGFSEKDLFTEIDRCRKQLIDHN